MKTKKGILKKFCIFIITILILTNPVLANQEQQEDKYTNYDLENIGIKISLENTSHKMSEACFLYDKTLTKIQKNGKLC